MTNNRTRVAVLMGGPSPERDVSLETGRVICQWLNPDKYEVIPIEITWDRQWVVHDGQWLESAPQLSQLVKSGSRPGKGGQQEKETADEAAHSAGKSIDQVRNEHGIDVAFIAMHGTFGEDGTVQGLLEAFGIPYTGSGVLASALAMDKIKTKEILRYQGIPTPDWVSLTRRGWQQQRELILDTYVQPLGLPCVVKPCRQGSSVGISIVREAGQLPGAIDEALSLDTEVLVEAYVKGRELTCAVLGEPKTEAVVPLPPTEIIFTGDFFDYESKYAGETKEVCPAELPPDVTEAVQDLACRTHAALGCRGFSRTDFILNDDGLQVLELNTIPGMTQVSLYPQAARAAGIEFDALMDRMVELALEPE